MIVRESSLDDWDEKSSSSIIAVVVYLHEKSIRIIEYKEKYTMHHANKVL